MSPNIPAVEATDEPAGNPLDGAELVVFSTDADHADFESQTEWGQQTGLISYSLWARFDDVEIPLYNASEMGVWLSFDIESYEPTPGEPVSDAFVEAICNMVDEETGKGWGDPTQDVYEAMSDAEKLIWQSVKIGFLEMANDEPALVIDWCTKRGEGE